MQTTSSMASYGSDETAWPIGFGPTRWCTRSPFHDEEAPAAYLNHSPRRWDSGSLNLSNNWIGSIQTVDTPAWSTHSAYISTTPRTLVMTSTSAERGLLVGAHPTVSRSLHPLLRSRSSTFAHRAMACNQRAALYLDPSSLSSSLLDRSLVMAACRVDKSRYNHLPNCFRKDRTPLACSMRMYLCAFKRMWNFARTRSSEACWILETISKSDTESLTWLFSRRLRVNGGKIHWSLNSCVEFCQDGARRKSAMLLRARGRV